MASRRDSPADASADCSEFYFSQPPSAFAAFRLSSRTQLRGTKSTAVLSHGGSLLGSSGGDGATYGLSSEVGALSTFISHNWSTARSEKFMALALYFNYPVMVASMVLSSAVTFGLTVSGVIQNSLLVDEDGNMWSKYTYCPSVAIGSAVVVLCLWHDIAPRIGAGGRMVFLDKTCIHQDDIELMREGIGRLGAYIIQSDEMVAVFSRHYLQKVWTVYELATFLLTHPFRQVRVMPLFLAPMFVGVMCIMSAWYMLCAYLRPYLMSLSLTLPVDTLGGIIVTTVVVYMLRRWAKDRATMDIQASAFSLKSAVCEVEEDRLQVQENVATLMRMAHLVEPHASTASAIDCFDAFMRKQLPKVFATNFGRCWSYRHCATAVACYWLGGIDILAVQWQAGVPTFTMIMWFLHHMSTTLLILPAVLGVAGLLTSRLAELGRCAEFVWLLFVGCLCFCLQTLLVGMHRAVTRWAIQSALGLVVHMGVTGALIGAVVLLFSCAGVLRKAGLKAARNCSRELLCPDCLPTQV